MSEVGSIDLDQLIAERKEEKRKTLKGKLNSKLKTIRDRRISGVNLEPFPEGAFERMKNNNIWETVLGNLADPSDVTSAYFACGTFSKILEEKRKLSMLPKALNLLKKNFAAPPGNSWNHWKTICLNIRGVSKAWKESADFQLFDSYFVNEDWFLKTNSLDFNKARRLNDCVLDGEDSVQRITSLFQDSESPSLVRFLHVIVCDDDDTDPEFDEVLGLPSPEPFYRKLLGFLQTYGRFVWFFYIDWSVYRNIVADYEWFCKMLKLMPNLKGLSFLIDYNVDNWRGEGIENFRRRLNENPFPALQSLKYFEWYSESDDESLSLLSQILRRCVNLKTVIFSEFQGLTDEPTEDLMNLTLECYAGLPAIITSNQVSWPLKHLTIMGREPLNLNASVLIPVINQFRETLQHLGLQGCAIQMDAASSNVGLDLPHLKSLEILIIRVGSVGFDELLPLKSLEKMILWYVEDENENALVKMKWYLDSGEMEKSNVWNCFPNLECVEVSRQYSRKAIYYRPNKV